MLRISYSDILIIKHLTHYISQEEKYNPHHGANGRFTTADQAHIIIHRDGRRELGPKHPDHPNNKLTPTQKAAKMLKEKYPNVGFNFEGVDPKFAPRIAEHLDHLFTSYPDALHHLDFIGTPQGKERPPDYAVEKNGTFLLPNAYAYVSMKHTGPNKYATSMLLNPDHFQNEAVLAHTVKMNAVSHWSPFGTHDPLSIITHEFGHLVHNNMLFNGEGKSIPALDFIGHNNEAQVASIAWKWSNLHADDGYAISKYASTTYDNNKQSGLKEMFAEGFSQMIHASPGSWMPFTMSLHKFLPFIGNSSQWSSTPRRVDVNHDPIALQKIEALLDTLKKSVQQEDVPFPTPKPGIEIEDDGKGYGPEPKKKSE